MDDSGGKLLKTFLIVLLFALVSANLSNASGIDSNEGYDNVDHREKYFGELKFKNLAFLYEKVQSFILGITGDGLMSSLAREFEIDLRNPSNLTVKKLQTVSSNLKSSIIKISRASIAYIVIVVIGLILAIFYLLSCLCFVCCRKAGCWCGKVKDVPSESKYSGPIRAFLIVVIIVVSTLLILAAYGSLASGLATTDGLKKDEKADLPFIGNVLIPMRDLFEYIPQAIKEVNDTLDVDVLTNQVNKFLPDFSVILQEQVQNLNESCRSCNELLIAFQNLTTYATKIRDNLESINRTVIDLEDQYDQFNSSLGEFKSQTLESSSDCSTDKCHALKNAASFLTDLRKGVGFEFPNLADHTGDMQEIKNFSIDAFLPEDLSKQKEEISKTARSFIQLLKDQFNKLPMESIMEYKNYMENPRDNIPSVPWSLVDTLYTHVPKAIKAIAIVTIAVVLLIVLLNIIGMIIGLNPKKNSQGVFLASTQLTFCIAPILCLVSIPLFVIGTLAYREGCYDVKKGTDSNYLSIVDDFLQFQLKDLSDFSFDNITFHFNTANIHPITGIIYNECKMNESLMKSVSHNLILDNSTLNQITNKIMPTIKDFVEKFNLTNLPIFSDENINKLKDIGTNLRNFSFVVLNEDIKSQNLTFPALETMRSLMEDARSDINASKKIDFDQLLHVTLTSLEIDASDIIMKEDILLKEINSTKESLKNIADKFNDLITMIKKTRDEIMDENIAEKLLETIEKHLKRTILDFYNFLIDALGQTLHCRQLFEIFDSVIFSVCDLIVNPLNALWFCLGIVIILFIPSFSFALYLGKMFARRNKIRAMDYH